MPYYISIFLSESSKSFSNKVKIYEKYQEWSHPQTSNTKRAKSMLSVKISWTKLHKKRSVYTASLAKKPRLPLYLDFEHIILIGLQQIFPSFLQLRAQLSDCLDASLDLQDSSWLYAQKNILTLANKLLECWILAYKSRNIDQN